MRRLLILLVPLALLGGIYWGGHPDALPAFARDAFVGDDESRVVAEAIDEVADEYYRDRPRGELADAAINGVLEQLDAFSAYFTPQEYREFRQASEGEFSGIGVTVTGVKAGLRVGQVYDGSPAAKAGVKPGDVIVAADGRRLAERPEGAAAALIKGESGTPVKLVWERDGKRITKTVTRRTITIPVVESRLERVDGRKLGYVSLAAFTSGAHAQLYEALRELTDRGARGFVLDLRNNGGGLVREAQLVASGFIPEGTIVTTRGRSVPERTLSATGDAIAPDRPVVVLVNRNSASASEIVTGALRDRRDAPVVGQETFGKGVFQQVIELSNGGALDLTSGVYVTPDGTTIAPDNEGKRQGLEPDVRAVDDPDTERDEARAEALDVLAGQLEK